MPVLSSPSGRESHEGAARAPFVAPAILAIEAYPDVLSAPFLWRTNDACAVVAYWTKHR